MNSEKLFGLACVVVLVLLFAASGWAGIVPSTMASIAFSGAAAGSAGFSHLGVGMPSEGEPASLIQRLCDGDSSALPEVTKKYQRLVYGIAIHQLRCPEDAEDVLQETFLKLCCCWKKNHSQWTSEDHLRRWLCRVATNKACDRLRQKRRRGELSLEEDINPSGEGENSSASLLADPHAVPPDVLVDRKDQQDRLVDILQSDLLTENERAALRPWAEGMTYEEIAAELGVPWSRVNNWIYRGLQKLKKEFGETER